MKSYQSVSEHLRNPSEAQQRPTLLALQLERRLLLHYVTIWVIAVFVPSKVAPPVAAHAAGGVGGLGLRVRRYPTSPHPLRTGEWRTQMEER
jgi:hypothetical protein